MNFSPDIPIDVPKMAIEEADLRLIFDQKCKDFGLKPTEKLFQRFIKHQAKKSFQKVFDMESCSLGPLAANSVANIIFNYDNIRVVHLPGNTIGDQGALSFASLLVNTLKIISLDLSSNSIGDIGGKAIFSALRYNKSLVSLYIGSTTGVGRNSFGSKALTELSETFKHNQVLSEIDLTMTEINADTIELLSQGLSQNTTLESMNLSNNNIQSRGAIKFITACSNSNLRVLNLSSNHIKDDVSQAFSHFFTKNKSIVSLNLSGNGLTAKFASAVSVPLGSSCPLRELNISRNPLTGAGIAAIGSSLVTNQHLRNLNASFCKIDASGFDEFCSRLESNTSLISLNAGHNPLRDVGAIRLSAVLKHHPSIREIDLELCEIGDNGASSLFSALILSQKIERVSVKNNLIKNGVPIQKAITENPRLLYLNIEFNDIDFKLFTEIQRLVRLNQKTWQDGHKDRIAEGVTSLGDVEVRLQEIRGLIRDERLDIEGMKKLCEEAKEQQKEAEASRQQTIVNLEARLSDISRTVADQLNDFRESHSTEARNLEEAAIDSNALQNKYDRELETFKRETKSLQVIDQKIADLQEENQRTLKELNMQWAQAVLKYKDVRQVLTESFNLAKGLSRTNSKVESSKESSTPKSPSSTRKKTKKGA